MVVAHFELRVGFVHPNHAAAGIAHEVVVKAGRACRGHIAKGADEIAPVLGGIEIEKIVVDLHAIADKLDGVAIAKIVVMDVKSAPAFRHGTARVFWDGYGG